jgi:hypothetical protein
VVVLWLHDSSFHRHRAGVNRILVGDRLLSTCANLPQLTAVTLSVDRADLGTASLQR